MPCGLRFATLLPDAQRKSCGFALAAHALLPVGNVSQATVRLYR
jgi:hypothetical protein